MLLILHIPVAHVEVNQQSPPLTAASILANAAFLLMSLVGVIEVLFKMQRELQQLVK